MNRRSFFKGLAGLCAVAALPKPERKSMIIAGANPSFRKDGLHDYQLTILDLPAHTHPFYDPKQYMGEFQWISGVDVGEETDRMVVSYFDERGIKKMETIKNFYHKES